MSVQEIRDSNDDNDDDNNEILNSNSSSIMDQSSLELNHSDNITNTADENSIVNKSQKELNQLTTISVNTNSQTASEIISIFEEFEPVDLAIYNQQETDNSDDNNDLDQTVITAKFDVANDADNCYLKIKNVIPNSQYNMEISYDSLSHPGNLYVRWAAPETTEDDLRKIFAKFGELTTCKIVYDDDNNSKFYGFVNFILKKSADTAIEELNNKEINGNRFYLNHHISKKERLSKLEMERVLYTNLYVKNIPEDISIDELRDLFAQYGIIESIFVPTIDDESQSNNNDLKLKGFGFVNYSNHEDAIKAQQSLNNFEISPGYHILVTKAQKRDKNDLNLSNVNDMQSMTRDFNRIRMFQSAPPPLTANYYTLSPNLAQNSQQAQFYYPPPTATQPNPQLFTPTMKNGLPIAGPNYQDSNLYIKNLPLEIGDDELTELFEPFGEIVSAKVITSDGEHSKGYGFVCFKSPQNASRALVEMSNYPIDDYHILHVSFAQRKDNRVGANGVIHHYNQNHFSYPSGSQPPRTGTIPIISPQELPASLQSQVLYNLIYPYYYYPPQGPTSPGYAPMAPPTSYPPGTAILPISQPLQSNQLQQQLQLQLQQQSQLQQQVQQQQQQYQSQKGTPRQFQNYQPLQYLTLLQLLLLTRPQSLIPQQLQPKSPIMIPNYGVDYYGRVISNNAGRYPPQQHRYVIPAPPPPPPPPPST